MGTHSSLCRTEVTASHDVPELVGSALTLTYAQIAACFIGIARN